MTKTLSIHLGGDIYFQIDGQWIDAPIDLEQFNEFEGGDPMKFYGTILEWACLLYTSPSPRDGLLSRMPSSA